MTIRSPLKSRRTSAAVALGGVALLGAALLAIDHIDALACCALAAMVGHVGVRRRISSSLPGDHRALLFMVALAALLEGATSDITSGALLFLRFSTLVLTAQIVGRLFSWAEISEGLVLWLSPLERLGLIDAERCAFTLMLAVRFVPVMFEEVTEIREAQALRGMQRSVLALAVPLGVRVLTRAEEIADAVDLRACDSRSTPLRQGGPSRKMG